MTIKEAIVKAKEAYGWTVAPHEPTSVDVDFVNSDGREDETEFDLYSDRMEEELEELFMDFCAENHFPTDTVTRVETLGYIS